VSPSSSSPSPSPLHPQGPSVKLHAVKITSPAKGQQVPIGKNLTILGTSIGNASTSNCQVIIGLNQIRPYPSATGTGPGGAADYSTWSHVLSSKYATLKPGPDNKITARYKCSGTTINNPNLGFVSSVNVTGVPNNLYATQIASSPHTGVIASPHTPVVSTPHTPSPSPTSTAVKQKEQQPVVAGNSDRPSSIGLNTPGTHNTPAVTYERKPVVASSNSKAAAGSNNNGSAMIAGINIPNALGINAAVTYEQIPVASSNSNTTGLNNNNSSGILSATSSLLGGKLINIGSSELSGAAQDGSSSSRAESTSFSHHTSTVSHEDNTGPHKTHMTRTSTVSHEDNTGPHKTHMTRTSTVSHEDNSAGRTLHDKINGLKNSIMDKVKKELESNGISVPLF
jgi:hypothetical protein